VIDLQSPWRALRLPAKFPNSNLPNPRTPDRQATIQEERAKQSIGVFLEKPSGKTGDSAEDIGSDAGRQERRGRQALG